MRSNNPVFNNNPAFNGQAAYGQGYPPPPPGYGAPQYAAPQDVQYGLQQTGASRPMTIDDVVQKTGLTLVVLIFAAAATWILTGDIDIPANQSKLIMFTGIGSIAGLVIGLICSFKRSMLSPALVLAYAACQGVFMGGVSKIFNAQYDGIVLQAVVGTIAASGGMLAAYKFLGIKVNDSFRKGFFAAAMGFLGLGLLEVVLSAFGHPMGLFGNGGAGFIFAAAGLAFGVVGLILDFDMVENGIRAGVPEKFSWAAAFGLTASIVMVYFYLLRLLAILRGDD